MKEQHQKMVKIDSATDSRNIYAHKHFFKKLFLSCLLYL